MNHHLMPHILLVSAICVLTQCVATVENGTLMAYPPPVRPLEQLAIIETSQSGARNFEFQLLDGHMYNTWGGFRRIAVLPGDVTITGLPRYDNVGKRTVHLEAGHRYTLLKAPVVKHDGRLLSPRQAASEVKKRTGMANVEARLGNMRMDLHQSMLETYFTDLSSQPSSASPDVMRVIGEYQRSSFFLVKDLGTGRYFTGSDPGEQRAFAALKNEISHAMGDDSMFSGTYSIPSGRE